MPSVGSLILLVGLNEAWVHPVRSLMHFSEKVPLEDVFAFLVLLRLLICAVLMKSMGCDILVYLVIHLFIEEKRYGRRK